MNVRNIRLHGVFLFCLTLFPLYGQNLSGGWEGTIYFGNLNAELNTSLFMAGTGNQVEGHSTKNASKRILGGLKGSLVKTFAKKTFHKGALLHLRNGKIERDTLRAVLSTIFGSSYWFVAPLHQVGLLQGTLEDNNGRLHGGFRFIKTESPPSPGYAALTGELFKLTREKIYRTEVLRQKPFPTFERRFSSISKQLRDDLEFYAAYYYLSRRKFKLPFTHYMLSRPAREIIREDSSPISRASAIPAKPVLNYLNDSTALIAISSFANHPVAEIDSAFAQLKEKQTPYCIIDLRENTGGTISSMRIAEHLVDSTLYAGFFLTNKWFSEYNSIPNISQYVVLPNLDESNLGKLWDGIHNTSGFKLKVTPAGEPYRGRVFILTSKKTASACEPLCYNLKFHGKAILVGQKTSGAMLNGESFSLKDGWRLEVPTADYYTADGQRLDLVGVLPTYFTEPGTEIKFIQNTLLQRPD